MQINFCGQYIAYYLMQKKREEFLPTLRIQNRINRAA